MIDPGCSELENIDIRVAAGDCSVTERRRWRRLIKPAKLYICTLKHYRHEEDGRTAPGVRGQGTLPLSHSWNVVTKILIY